MLLQPEIVVELGRLRTKLKSCCSPCQTSPFIFLGHLHQLGGIYLSIPPGAYHLYTPLFKLDARTRVELKNESMLW
jgi:hypothetical protein